MKFQDISPAFKTRIDDLRTIIRTDTPYRLFVERALDGLQSDYTGIPDLMNYLLESQRLIALHLAGTQNSEKLQELYQSNRIQSYYQYKSPPVEPELLSHLADKIYNMRESKNDYGMLQTDDGVRRVAENIIEKMMVDKHPFDVHFIDAVFKNTLMNEATEDGLQHLADYQLKIWQPVTRRMGITPISSMETPPDVDKQKQNFFSNAVEPIHQRIMNGEIHFTISSVPTRKDAELDNIPYEDYLTLFFEMCDQPWEQVNTAQKILIDKLNAGKLLRFTNSDGTDISMDIDRFTFANSVIARNIPGSEAFSGMKKESVNGTIVAQGKFTPSGKKGKVVEDITLVFKDGKCIEYSAKSGEDILKDMIETDNGSCYLGEIGIGTNPYMKRHVANITMVEKISGSFHVALGDAYTQTHYMGTPVTLDNGNRSLIHWDITTMLYGKNGVMELDGNIISKNGYFTDPALDVLNRGWEAIPVSQRPDYWKNYDFAKSLGLPKSSD